LLRIAAVVALALTLAKPHLAAAVLTTTYLNFGHERDFVFCVETEFTIDSGDGLRGDFLLLPDLASLKAIFDAIRLS
jgi:chemotaxis protein CheC